MTWSRAYWVRIWSIIHSLWRMLKVNVDICTYHTRCTYQLWIFTRSLRLLPDSVRLSTLDIDPFTPAAARLGAFINSSYWSVHSGCCQTRCAYHPTIHVFCLFTKAAGAWYKRVYSIRYKNEGTSLSVSDVDLYVITRKWLYSILNVLPLFIRRWEFQACVLAQTLLP
jgi:hypothetical protein